MGTADVQGRLWGARARDYACLAEGAFRPLFEAVFDSAEVGDGTRLLDVGCGTGLAAALAARRGARVAGLDAAVSSIAIARERTPPGEFRVGEMEALPWPDHTFDVVTGFNAFQYAADIVASLREARRIVQPAGRVAIAIWGRQDECETSATVLAVIGLLPPPPAGTEGPFALAEPGRLEAILFQAGLTPLTGGEVDCPFEFADLEQATRAIMSAGPIVAAAERVGTERIEQTVRESLAPFRTDVGGYVQRNRFRYLIATP